MSLPSWLRDLGDGLLVIDAGYLKPDLAAIHVLHDQGRVGIIDTGTVHSVSRVMTTLDLMGLNPSAVDWVILTHVHLDHAGGAGAIMAALPAARLTVHPRGARHVLDPSRLWTATCEVYGEQQTVQLYGELIAVPPERILETPDGTCLRLGSRELQFLDVPGHARHHVAIHDVQSQRVFSGDTFGISYRALDVNGRAFIYPTSTPSQFDPNALRRSVDRILALKPRSVALTHFSTVGASVEDVMRLGAAQQQLIDTYESIALAHQNADIHRRARIAADMKNLLFSQAREHGVSLSDAALNEVIGHDVELNTDGLLSWLDAKPSTMAA
jgi:hydroxyacylglutathione hydrolase